MAEPQDQTALEGLRVRIVDDDAHALRFPQQTRER